MLLSKIIAAHPPLPGFPEPELSGLSHIIDENEVTDEVDKESGLSHLIDENENPIGGKWSFDTDNRKKYPKTKTPPTIKAVKSDEFYKEAIEYVQTYFSKNLG